MDGQKLRPNLVLFYFQRVNVRKLFILISIVITSFNRAKIVINSIDSAISFIDELSEGEIIIVDDNSSDNTVEWVTNRYVNYLQNGRVKLVQHSKNLGVTGAKNTGAKNAKYDWIMFLDSDDTLVPMCSKKILKIISSTPISCPVIFFRCINEDGEIVGQNQVSNYWLNLKSFLHNGTPGECLPIVKKIYFNQYFFEEDLRGFEGLTYARLIKAFGPALVSPFIARVYGTDNMDRLCAPINLRARGCLLARGNLRLTFFFFSTLGITGCIISLGKAIFHLFRCFRSKFFLLF